MAVVLAAELADIALEIADDCFYCGESATERPLVIWVGNSGDLTIALHPACAGRLALHLAGDMREAQLASGAQPWAMRVSRAAGHALRAQEAAA